MHNQIVAPSILSADFSELGNAIKIIDQSGAKWAHMDIMDGAFVPNITFGAKVIQDLRPISAAIFDVHLMVEKPERHYRDFIKAGADYITFHIEACTHAHRLIMKIKELGKKAGISIVPSTPVAAIQEILPFLDLVLVMTVNPGFGGQELIPSCLNKISQLKKMRDQLDLSYRISADGGLNLKTAKSAWDAGTDVLVVGSAFFASNDKACMINELLQ